VHINGDSTAQVTFAPPSLDKFRTRTLSRGNVNGCSSPTSAMSGSASEFGGRKRSISSKGSKSPRRNRLVKQFSRWFTQNSELQDFQPHVDFLQMIASPMITLEKYLQTIIAEVCRKISAEHCDAFFVNEVRREIWCVGMPDQETARIPWDTGSIGEAAHYGRILNLTSEDFDVEDFSHEAERLPGGLPRCVLIVPVKHMNADKLHTIGIIRAVNKIGSASFEDGDITELSKIAMLSADSFYRQSWAALFRMSSAGDQQATSMMAAATDSDLYNVVTCPARVRQTWATLEGIKEAPSSPKRRRADRDDATSSTPHPHVVSFLSETMDASGTAVSSSQRLSSTMPKLASLDFNALEEDPVGLVHLVPRVMEELECCARCNVKLQQVVRWAEATRGLYHDHPFHNWFHGFSVFQMCYYQLRWTEMADSLRAVDVFGLLIAALCHDVDHPAVNNAYLIATESDLALRYNDVSVLENHHASLACQLMKSPATTIVDGMEKAEKAALRKVVIASILATDMSHHADQCKKLLSCEQHLYRADSSDGTKVSHEGRQMLLSASIHAADLAAQTLPWRIAKQWEERISQEFVNQAETEVSMGWTPAPFMHFEFSDLRQRGKLQCNFIDFVLVPLWDPYSQLFPALRVCFDGLLQNRKQYDLRRLQGADAEVQTGGDPEYTTESTNAPMSEAKTVVAVDPLPPVKAPHVPPSPSKADPVKPPGEPPRLDTSVPSTSTPPPDEDDVPERQPASDAASPTAGNVSLASSPNGRQPRTESQVVSPSVPAGSRRVTAPSAEDRERSPEIEDVSRLRVAADTATGKPDELQCPVPSTLLKAPVDETLS